VRVSTPKITAIEGMRGLAALYVAVGHVFTMVDPHQRLRRPAAQPEWLSAVASPFWYGHLAVAAFITISGFCLQWALLQRGDGTVNDFVTYLRRRCRRILPPYYACLMLSLLVAWGITSRQTGLPWTQYLPITWENVGAHLLLIHNWSPDWMYKINGVLWSIAIEFQLYFVLPVLAWLLAKRGPWVVAAGLSIPVFAILATYPKSEKFYIWYALLFALGMIAAKWAMAPVRFSSSAWLALAVLGLGAGMRVAGEKSIPLADLCFAFGTCALMVLVVQAPLSLASRVLSWRPLLALGAFSYSLYLMHHPILQAVFVTVVRPYAITPAKQIAALGTLGLCAAILGCIGFYWYFERPFVGSKRPS
jgi:peptidoglycan/LPS O-acetylase OafA/YrhL